MDADGEVVHGGVVAAGAQPHGAGGKVRGCVQAKNAVRAVEHVRGNERARALTDLFGGLEEKTHLAAEVRAVCAQDLCRAEKACRVRVVAAGMHHARGLGTVRHVVRLLNGQGVNIRAQHADARAAACAVQAGDDGGLAADALMRDAAFVKLALDARSGMVFM